MLESKAKSSREKKQGKEGSEKEVERNKA